jgi:subtilisin family serine protease
MNNIAREKSKVTEVATPEKAQQNNLPQAYTGKGVLVGLVDTGIDFNHAAFRNPDGSTRIRLAMKIVSGELKVYTNPEEIAALTSDRTDESHGTHDAGIAAGSFIKGLNRQGVAPEAGLMLCGLGGYLYESDMIMAITKMLDYAKEQGMPCVVNTSMGNVSNFHDGTSTAVVRGLREYYKTEEDKKGRICVFSAGNSGDAHAAIYTVLPEADSDGYNLRTVLGESKKRSWNGKQCNSYTNISNFFYNQDGSEFDVDLKVVDVNTGQVYTLEEKPIYGTSGYESEVYKNNRVSTYNNKHYVEFFKSGTILFHEPNLKLAYFVKSEKGKTFRAMDKRTTMTSGFYSEFLEGYTSGQDNGAFSIHICCDEVIGVGFYHSATSYTDINGEIQSIWSDSHLDKIHDYSSWGTDDNGVNHPDVIAPGSVLCSAYNIYDETYFDKEGKHLTGSTAADLTDSVTLYGRKHYYGIMEGTSMAAPHVAGIIALWLQAKPDMTYDDVRALIKETSYNDEYTTNPNLIPSWDVRQAGAGKIDALAGLQKIVGPTAINMVGEDDPRHATPATMYDVDDNCYNTLGQRVCKNAKGLVIYKGRVYFNK